MEDLRDEIQAATVVPLRDSDNGLEVLMLRKNSKLAYGGMWVFPGGRVDLADGDPLVDGEQAVAQRAAAREAMEEAALVVDPASLVPFSHWTPPVQAPRRFLTWFFLAPARTAFEVVVDGGEIHEHVWSSPAEMIRRRDAGEVELAPPTWMTLRRLSRSVDVDGALKAAAEREPERFETHVVPTDGAMLMIWEGDSAWESGEPDQPGPRHRLVAGPGPWEYQGPA